jgi:hypothetical protein
MNLGEHEIELITELIVKEYTDFYSGEIEMFDQQKEIYLIKETLSIRKRYSITSDKKVVGTVEETTESAGNLGNQLLKLISLYSAASLELTLLDEKENKLGVLRKGKGFYKDFLLYSEKDDYVATITAEVKVKAPKLTVYDVNGKKIIEAIGGYGATDFRIMDLTKDRQLSSIKRRSMVYSTVKENLLNDDGYFIDITTKESLLTFFFIVMGIMIDNYFFQN